MARTEGYTIFLTGLAAAGKSTIASALADHLIASGRTVTVLDGDHVRSVLSTELGYSRVDRDTNVLRIGFVATEVTRHGGVAICACIAPFAATRQRVRASVMQHGRFLEVYVSTPLKVCEQRDPKGLYVRARTGLLRHVSGIDDPYEPPENPEVQIDTNTCSTADAVSLILRRVYDQANQTHM